MAEVIIPPEELEPELPEEQLPEVEKPTEKSKVISVNFSPLNTKQTANLDTRGSFFTTDTDAWIVLKIDDMSEPTGQYSLALMNKQDGSIFQRAGDIVQGVAYYKLLPNEIKHAGRWVGQAVITLANGQTTASRFSFAVSGHILDGKDVREIVIQDFQTLMKQLNDLKDNEANEFGLLKSEIEDFQTIAQENENERKSAELERVAAEIRREESYESKVDAAIVEADVVEKVDNKVAELSPAIQEVTAQLAQNVQETTSLRTHDAVRPIVSLLCDDGYVDDYNKLKPISDQTGVPMTLAIVSNDMDNTNRIFSHAHMDKLRELVEVNGFEVTAHTADHLRLGIQTYEEQENQLKKNKEQLEQYGFSPKSIVYPFGSYNEDTLKIAPKYYECGYAAGTNTLNDSPIDTLSIGRIQFDPSNPNNNLEWYKAKVDEAVAGNKWVIFMLHCSPTLGWMEEPQQQMLVDLINYVKSVNVEIMTCHEAFLQFRNVYETVDGKYRIGFKASLGGISQTQYLANDTLVDETTPLKGFPIGISYKTFIFHEQKNFPISSAGTLTTYNWDTRTAHSYQEWQPYDSAITYQRRWVIENGWSEWAATGGVTFLANSSTNATLPNNYGTQRITVERLTTAYAASSLFPVTDASILTTVANDEDYVYQELRERTGTVYSRIGISNIWSKWDRLNNEIQMHKNSVDASLDASINVTGVDRLIIYKTTNNVPISSFTGGLNGQEIIIINALPYNGDLTIKNYQTPAIGTIHLKSKADTVVSNLTTIRLLNIQGKWYEV